MNFVILMNYRMISGDFFKNFIITAIIFEKIGLKIRHFQEKKAHGMIKFLLVKEDF